MTNDEIRNASAQRLAPLLEIAQAMTKLQENIRNIPFEELTPEDWKSMQLVSYSVDALSDYVIQSITMGAQLLEDDSILNAALKHVND